MQTDPFTLSPDDQERIIQQFWNKDGRLYTDQPEVLESVKNRQGWIDVSTFTAGHLDEITAFAEQVRSAGIKNVVLLGMGGSSLSPLVFGEVIGPAPGYASLFVLDTTDPEEISKVEASVSLEETLFLVSSKSGTTIEPNALFAYFHERLEAAVEVPGRHFTAVTDKDTVLHRLSEEQGFLKTWINPSDIGGRYSALSLFGMVPAALMGLDIGRMLERASRMESACKTPRFTDNPGARLGAFMAKMAHSGRNKLTLLTSPHLSSFGLWVEQLIAESTGKNGTGVVPIVREPFAGDYGYGPDRCFVVMRQAGDEDSSLTEAVNLLREQGFPLETIELEDPADLAGEMFRWEMAAALCGVFLGINPFDEPNVSESKANTSQILDSLKEHGELPLSLSPPLKHDLRFGDWNDTQPEETFARLFQNVPENGYVAYLLYLPYGEPAENALRLLRSHTLKHLKSATAAGFGPRYLHSTGQEHKGGPQVGAFVLVTRPPSRKPDVPGFGFSFGDLQIAQALGDYRALTSRGLPSVHVHLPEDWEGGLKHLVDLVGEALAASTA
jgi:glucose-6-phosphate isomerase